MKKIIFLLLASIALFTFNGCYFLVAKPIIQEISLKNETGNSIKVIDQEDGETVILKNDKKEIIDVNNSDLLKISFSDSNTFFEYDISPLFDDVDSNEELSPDCIWGHIHWGYACIINKDKVLMCVDDNDADKPKVLKRIYPNQTGITK